MIRKMMIAWRRMDATALVARFCFGSGMPMGGR
jgi:hypothetical protein